MLALGARIAAAALLAAAGAAAPSATADDGTGPVSPQLRLAQGKLGPYLAVRPTVVAEPAGTIPLLIRVVPPDAAPGTGLLRLTGLPPTATLSAGHAIAPGAWAVPLDGLSSLTLSLPASVSGRAELVIMLVGEDGRLLDQA